MPEEEHWAVTSEYLGASFDFNDLVVGWASPLGTLSTTQQTTAYGDISFWNVSKDLQISMPQKSLSAKGDLTRVSNHLPSLQHASRVVMQMLYAYPRMMLRRQTFPPFIHPHWHQEHLPEALGNCMSISQLFASRTPETMPFLWKIIAAEQDRFRDKLSTFNPWEVHLCLQVMIIYMIMAMSESDADSKERTAILFETVELIGSRFLDLTGSYSSSEATEPSRTWEVWIFAESRRRMSCELVDAMTNPGHSDKTQKLENWETGSDNLAAMLKVVVEFVWASPLALRPKAMKQLVGQGPLTDFFPHRSTVKRKEIEQSPSPLPSPKRQERAASFISVSSDQDEHDGQEFMGPPLCKEQQDLVDLIMSGRNVFFTGSAGCGKSTVLKTAITQLRADGRNVAVTAPTGRAALNLDGVTLFSYMGWKPDDVKLSLDKLKCTMSGKPKQKTRKSLRETHVLVIDEISMVENNFLSQLEAVLCAIRNNQGNRSPPWGGLQLIVTGDFCQLPPVDPFQNCWHCGETQKEWQVSEEGMICSNGHGPWEIDKDKWAFRSPAWETAEFVYVNLKEIHRQSDRPFIKTLQKCRLGIPLVEHDFELLLDNESEVGNATHLVCKKIEAAKLNDEKLAEITEHTIKEYTCEDDVWFSPSYKGPKDGFLTYFESHRFNPKVQLKETQLVMLLVNLNLKKGLANGSQGVIVGWEKIDIDKLPVIEGPDAELKTEHVLLFTEQYKRRLSEPEKQVWPVVRFNNGYKKTVYPVCLVHSVNGQPGLQLFRTQIPLISGWAITIHKSQGMTLERVIVNLKSAFVVGQACVALSRATTLRGLHIQEGNRESLVKSLGRNPEVHDFLKGKFGEQLYADHAGSTN
ncbi:atp-dependent dna helicase pif1 [Fusarium langsethiae]|uniref:ATP-dependent DNA helicase n=1 Tax=Fusarium langsethiae TaxID=179993 RepID=A0A0M9EST1_FUSLA|nr:atp-dependent dna helicase pif1 [Fusarium langsethiae]